MLTRRAIFAASSALFSASRDQESESDSYQIYGSVRKPGEYKLRSGMTISEAIIAAGGLMDAAKRDRIYILRDNRKLIFNYAAFERDRSPDILLQSHDRILVPSYPPQ